MFYVKEPRTSEIGKGETLDGCYRNSHALCPIFELKKSYGLQEACRDVDR